MRAGEEEHFGGVEAERHLINPSESRRLSCDGGEDPGGRLQPGGEINTADKTKCLSWRLFENKNAKSISLSHDEKQRVDLFLI